MAQGISASGFVHEQRPPQITVQDVVNLSQQVGLLEQRVAVLQEFIKLIIRLHGWDGRKAADTKAFTFEEKFTELYRELYPQPVPENVVTQDQLSAFRDEVLSAIQRIGSAVAPMPAQVTVSAPDSDGDFGTSGRPPTVVRTGK